MTGYESRCCSYVCCVLTAVFAVLCACVISLCECECACACACRACIAGNCTCTCRSQEQRATENTESKQTDEDRQTNSHQNNRQQQPQQQQYLSTALSVDTINTAHSFTALIPAFSVSLDIHCLTVVCRLTHIIETVTDTDADT